MALIRIGVADRRKHRHLLLGVERRDSRKCRMPEEPRILGEGGAAAERERRAELLVLRVALRRQHRQGVGAAFEEHRDEDRLRRPGRRGRDALLQRAHAELRAAVDGEHRAEARRDERLPRHSRARRERHPALDRRQAASGLGHCLVQKPRAGETVAVQTIAHAAWNSGLIATSWRSAFCTIGGYCCRFQSAPAMSVRAPSAKRVNAFVVAGPSVGCFQNWIA